MSNIYNSVQDVQKDFEKAKAYGYTRKEYLEEALNNSDINKHSIRMLNKWFRRR